MYKNTQIGTVILAATAIGLIVLLLTTPTNQIWPGLIVLVVVNLIFGSLTITINKKRLSWHFGLGLIKKSLAIAEIETIKRIETKWYWGFGIRRLVKGWLYNVSGNQAIEIKTKSGKYIYLGTNEPEQLVNQIEVEKE